MAFKACNAKCHYVDSTIQANSEVNKQKHTKHIFETMDQESLVNLILVHKKKSILIMTDSIS